MDHQGYHHKNQKCNNFNNVNSPNVFNKFRKWIKVGAQQEPGVVFSVLSYNVLSQSLLEQHSYLYQNHQRHALQWDKRLNNLMAEIHYANPDILCCQEIQKSHLEQLKARMHCLNYDVLYKKRTGDKPDGAAIFYRKHLFSLKEQHNIEFEQPGIELLDRENVAIIAKFTLKSDPGVDFVVATTHLLYNPKRQDIRLAQVQILLAELDRVSKVAGDDEDSRLPIILSGDFNLQPYSAPYQLVINGQLNFASLSQRTLSASSMNAPNPPNGRKLLPIKLGITDQCQHVHHEIKLYHSENNKTTVQYDNDIELTKEIVNLFQTGVLKHNFNFRTVYFKPEKYVSTYQDRWILVDYIFYTIGTRSKSNKLTLLEYLSLPSAEECNSVGLSIPNHFLGSDHLSLLARFHIASKKPSSNNVPSTSTKL